LAGSLDKQATSQSLSIAQSNRTDDSLAQELLDLEDQDPTSVHNLQGLVESRQFTGKSYVDYRAADGQDPSGGFRCDGQMLPVSGKPERGVSVKGALCVPF
jgi:hypothetical protein